MIYDIETYRYAITPQIQLWMSTRPNVTPVSQISNIALATSCPILVVCQILEELYGVSPELTSKIERLREFYK